MKYIILLNGRRAPSRVFRRVRTYINYIVLYDCRASRNYIIHHHHHNAIDPGYGVNGKTMTVCRGFSLRRRLRRWRRW